MAHMLENFNDMAYFGETPWHRMGVALDRPMSIEEALEFGAVNFTVKKVPLFLSSGVQAPGGFAIIRTDNQRVLGYVGERYEEIQTEQALSCFNEIVTSRKEGILHTVGSLNGGAKVWFLAGLGRFKVVGDDVVDKHLLIATSHDGTMPTIAKGTPTRVVCANTFQVALREKGTTHKIRHTKTATARLADVTRALALANSYYSDLEDACRVLQRKDMTATETFRYIDAVFATEKSSADKGSTRSTNILEKVYGLVEVGKGADMRGVRGTAWGAYNAITEYIDNVKSYRTDDTALENIAFGGVGGSVKQRAWDLALAL